MEGKAEGTAATKMEGTAAATLAGCKLGDTKAAPQAQQCKSSRHQHQRQRPHAPNHAADEAHGDELEKVLATQRLKAAHAHRADEQRGELRGREKGLT